MLSFASTSIGIVRTLRNRFQHGRIENYPYSPIVKSDDIIYEQTPLIFAVFVLFAGEWDMRRAALAGQSEKMRRYIDKCFEEASTVLRNMQARGSNATRANLILDLGSLSFQVQACPRCKYKLFTKNLFQETPSVCYGGNIKGESCPL